MFDAAHAFGCSHKGRMVGSFGDAEVFSFHATKFFNTFEGGAVVTDDDELAEKIRRMKNFGFVEYDEVAEAGTNGKMNEICAAQGLTSLESLDSFISTNLGNYELYEEELQSVPGIKPILYDEDESNNYQYLVLEVDEAEAGIGQRRSHTCPMGRKRTRPEILLPRMPQNGALPLAQASGGATHHGKSDREARNAAHRHGGRAERSIGHLQDHPRRCQMRRRN